MSTVLPRSATPRGANFHDAVAREIYATRFRAIGIQAVAAGTRRAPAAFDKRARDLPAILRNGFDD